ncbi:MAG: ABC transporter ATP-binding protein/permease [Rickettsiales bacterium]|jgi:ATP-binding cassette subfamily B protein|nr:ABC transporter ATP-binding protein/permease [Rickettsiales bacterium]
MSADTGGENCFDFLSGFFRVYTWRIFIAFFILTVLVDFVEFLGGNYVLRVIIDKLGNKDALSCGTVMILLLVYPLMVSISYPSATLQRKIRFPFVFRLKEDVRISIFQHLLRQSNSFFVENLPGTLNSKINDIVGDIPYFIDNSFDLCSSLLTLLALVGLFSFKNLYLGLTMIILTTVYILMFYYFSRELERKSEMVAAAESLCSGKMMDCLVNIVSVKSFSQEIFEKANIKKQTRTILKVKSEQQFMRAMVDLFNFISMYVLLCAVSSIAFSLYKKGTITLGEFMFIVQTTTSIFWWLKVATQKFMENAELFAEMNKATKTLLVEHRIVDNPGAHRSVIVEDGKIEFKNVYFRYAKNKPYVFENLSFTIEANQKVGIVGCSGAGKSTLISLLTRIYETSEGGIFIDGHNIKTDITQSSLRKNISYVPQEPALFHRSIGENIGYGKYGATPEEIKEASIKANCYEFIAKLDKGFDSVVGERGLKLSGGQRQRIAVAMAILKNSKILVLDEATSSLDSLTEREIQDTIRKHMIDKTVIVIAHRLSTLSYIDRIVVFDDGKIVEDGSRDELLNSENGLFRSMWNMQKSGISI